MDIAQIQTRLQALHVGGKPVFLDVFGTFELAAIIETGNPQRNPTAYVVRNADLPSPAVEGSGPTVQRMTADLVVVTAIKAVNSVRAASDNLGAVSRAVIASLYDWTPPGADTPLTRGPSRLLAFRNGWIYWADSFRCDYWE